MRSAFAQISTAALLAATLGSAPALAGGFLESYDLTGNVPSPNPGQINARLVRIFHDPRCIPVQWHVNDTLDPIPNPLGAPFLSLADATAAFERTFDTWNKIPTSYIEERIVGTVSNPGLPGFDMVNELTFNTAPDFGDTAATPYSTLMRDTQLKDGDDLNGDGISDVSSAITTCTVAPDGHTLFPAGFYKAGTILDVDTRFNVKAGNGFRFTVNDADVDTNIRSVDLQATATHEFGHSIGLAHSVNNQKSATDGNASTMFPVLDTGDPAAELAQRTLDSDDIAFASYLYPEGTALSGPAALQPGDVPFGLAYGLIKGSVTHGVLNQPLAGAVVSATNALTGEIFSSAFSGASQVSLDPTTGSIFAISPSYNILDGNYTLPVKLGLYNIGIAPVDGLPFTTDTLNEQLGQLFGQQNFNEEFWSGPGLEDSVEVDPGFSVPVVGVPGLTQSRIDFVTNKQINISNFGSRDFVGFTGGAPGSYYAVRIPASQIAAVNPRGNLYIQAGLFETFVFDSSVAPVFAEADLVTGTVSGGAATLDLAHPLARATGFLGRDNDFAPFYFPLPGVLGRQVLRGIERGEIENLFLVLRLPTTTPFAGVSGLPPTIGLDGGRATNDSPIFGYSYRSPDGVTWTQNTTFNFRFSLVVTKPD